MYQQLVIGVCFRPERRLSNESLSLPEDANLVPSVRHKCQVAPAQGRVVVVQYFVPLTSMGNHIHLALPHTHIHAETYTYTFKNNKIILSALAIVPDIPILNPKQASHNVCNSSSRRSDTLFWLLWAYIHMT